MFFFSMRLFYRGKDGGPESNVTGFWLIEIKSLFSVALLRFSHGTRESFHSHAFNCISWVFTGKLREEHLSGDTVEHLPSKWPVITRRNTFHRVFSVGVTWVLTFRGPWSRTWKEFDPKTEDIIALSNGRKVESRTPAGQVANIVSYAK